MHTAPNPAPAVGKAHDISFEREKTIMRIIHREGAGPSVREGSIVTVHVRVQQPGPDSGKLVDMYNSEDSSPEGIQFEHGRTLHSEALDLAVKDTMPGSVLDVFCTCPDTATDHTLGIFPSRLSEAAASEWCKPRSPIGVMQGACDPPGMEMTPELTKPPWRPPRYVTVYHVRVDSASEGRIPMYMDSYERLEYCVERKNFGTDLFKRGRWQKAMRRHVGGHTPRDLGQRARTGSVARSRALKDRLPSPSQVQEDDVGPRGALRVGQRAAQRGAQPAPVAAAPEHRRVRAEARALQAVRRRALPHPEPSPRVDLLARRSGLMVGGRAAQVPPT